MGLGPRPCVRACFNKTAEPKPPKRTLRKRAATGGVGCLCVWVCVGVWVCVRACGCVRACVCVHLPASPSLEVF